MLTSARSVPTLRSLFTEINKESVLVSRVSVVLSLKLLLSVCGFDGCVTSVC